MQMKRAAWMAVVGLLANAGAFCVTARAGEPAADGLQGKIDAEEKKLRDLEDERERIKSRLRALKRERQETDRNKVTDIYKTQFWLPLLVPAPKIDGVMEHGEWEHAVAVPLASGGANGAAIQERPAATAYLGWNPENLFLAQRLPIRRGEKLRRVGREPKHDNAFCWETAAELFIDCNSHGSHPSKCKWQFMGNASGNKWDREAQYEIGQNYIDWNGEWQFRQRITPDGKYWEAEFAIPRTTIYQKRPTQAGDLWKLGVALDMHNPWTWSGFYGWKIPATFKSSMPIVRMSDIQKSLRERAVAFDMDIHNGTAEVFRGELLAALRSRSATVFEKRWPISIEPGRQAAFHINEKPGNKVQDGKRYSICVVVKRGGQSIYTWSHSLGYGLPGNKIGLRYTPDPNPFVTKLAYAPVSHYLRVSVDKYDYERRSDVARAEVSVTARDSHKVLASATLDEFKYERQDALLDLPHLAPGAYVCATRLIGKDGRELVSRRDGFEVRDLRQYPWLGNELGKDKIVPKPFVPLKVDGHSIVAFKKEIRTGGCGLPRRIVVDAEELLAGPVRLEMDSGGETASLDGGAPEPALTTTDAIGAEYEGRGTCGGLSAATRTRWEYDSTAKVTMALSSRSGRPVRMDGLRLVVPFTKGASLNFYTLGKGMRVSSHAGRIPAKSETGVVWTSREVPKQPMTVGSFVPIVWVGNRAMGLTWFADSDEGWWPTDERAAIEMVRRHDGGVDLVLNLASTPVELSRPRTITFGLNVNPVRPMSEHRGSVSTFGAYQERGLWVPGKSGRKEFALRFPQDPARSRALAETAHRHGGIYAPYTEMSAMDMPEHEATYFQEEFTGSGLVLNDVSNACLLYWSDRFFTECLGDGYYFDNVFPRTTQKCKGIGATAYRLPDGRVQPGYCFWAQRDHFQRMRVLLQKRRPASRICIHNTRFQFPPIMAFADLAMGGEMATPHQGSPDFMAMYPRDFIEVMYNPYLWGYKLSHLYHFNTKSYVNEDGEYDQPAAMKVHRGAMGTMLAHGVDFFNRINYDRSLVQKYRLLKKACGGDMEFIPYWKSRGLFEVEGGTAESAVGVWRGKGAILVIVTNYATTARTVNVWLDLPKLLPRPGATEGRVVMDFETSGGARWARFKQNVPDETRDGRKLAVRNRPSEQSMVANTLAFRVDGRDFRAIVISNLPLSQGGTGF